MHGKGAIKEVFLESFFLQNRNQFFTTLTLLWQTTEAGEGSDRHGGQLGTCPV
jgi:hypothetical protein